MCRVGMGQGRRGWGEQEESWSPVGVPYDSPQRTRVKYEGSMFTDIIPKEELLETLRVLILEAYSDDSPTVEISLTFDEYTALCCYFKIEASAI